jgi:hypothetical protein
LDPNFPVSPSLLARAEEVTERAMIDHTLFSVEPAHQQATVAMRLY